MTLKRFYNLFLKDLYCNYMVNFVERNSFDLIEEDWQCSVSVIEHLCYKLMNKKVTSWSIVKHESEDCNFMLRIELTTKEQTK